MIGLFILIQKFSLGIVFEMTAIAAILILAGIANVVSYLI